MTAEERKAWDVLGPDTFIHSCDCPTCHSLRDDSGRSCLGCRDHHVKAVAAAAELKRFNAKIEDAEGITVRICQAKEMSISEAEPIARAVSAWLKEG